MPTLPPAWMWMRLVVLVPGISGVAPFVPRISPFPLTRSISDHPPRVCPSVVPSDYRTRVTSPPAGGAGQSIPRRWRTTYAGRRSLRSTIRIRYSPTTPRPKRVSPPNRRSPAKRDAQPATGMPWTSFR